MKNIRTLFIIQIIIALSVTGCKKTIVTSNNEDEIIRDFIAERGYVADEKPSGLFYIETTAGTGISPVLNDTVVVHYIGMFLSGTVFDSKLGAETLSFTVGAGEVIAGWDEGVAYMMEGGKAMLVIPSSLGYGPYGYGTIPGNTPLLFEIELLQVIEGPDHTEDVK